jgi:hypothetical protein
MPQIFIFTASNPEAQRNLAISIEIPIDEAAVLSSFASAPGKEPERIRAEGNGFYTWGAVPSMRNIPNWETMQRDDYIHCVYDNASHYVAWVLATHDNRWFD